MGMLFVNMGEGDEKEKKSLLLGAHRDGSISLLKATGNSNKLSLGKILSEKIYIAYNFSSL